jgi:hypothetical protein
LRKNNSRERVRKRERDRNRDSKFELSFGRGENELCFVSKVVKRGMLYKLDIVICLRNNESQKVSQNE